MATPAWRWIDTGVRRPAENLALNRALLEARQAREIPSTLRFLRFTPAALVGHHQDPAQELDLAYCASRGIAVQRRLTAAARSTWTRTCSAGSSTSRAATSAPPRWRRSRGACARCGGGDRALGVAAEYRAPTDIVVAGRKISGTGGRWTVTRCSTRARCSSTSTWR